MVFLLFTKKNYYCLIFIIVWFSQGSNKQDNFSSNYFQTRCLSRLFLTIPRNTFLRLDFRATKNSADYKRAEYVNYVDIVTKRRELEDTK